jgi:type II secretory pathway component PulF
MTQQTQQRADRIAAWIDAVILLGIGAVVGGGVVALVMWAVRFAG